jgi:hypothetical protein
MQASGKTELPRLTWKSLQFLEKRYIKNGLYSMPILNTPYIAYFDGACEPINPGGTASYGAVILQAGEPIWMSSEIFRPENGNQTSNNLAEYSGLIAVLEWFAEHRLFDAEIRVFGDSKLVINFAVGTPITGRPPLRSTRAAFPHVAPTLGV